MSNRYEELPIPYGWFYVGAHTDIEVGEIRNLRRFSKDLILWRGESGKLFLQEAHCVHLGAHIGHGGKVEGDTIQCPFHKWKFNGSNGSVAEIPYAKQINKFACQPTLPVIERFGFLMAWYHPNYEEPIFELPSTIPELDSGEYVGPIINRHVVNTHIQEMAENTVDSAHFVTVHGHPGDAAYEAVEFRDHIMDMDSTQHFPSSRGTVEGTLKTFSYGFGYAEIRYQTVIETIMLSVNAPIEKDQTEQVFAVFWKNPEKNEKIDRIGESFTAEVNRQFVEEDGPIWEHKAYRERPMLCDGDGPIVPFRKWAKRFYVEETGAPIRKVPA